MKTAFSFDWFRATVPFDTTAVNIFKRAEDYFPTQVWREIGKRQVPYINGKECDFCSLQWHDQHAEFGVMLQATGVQLSAMEAAGHDPAVFIEHALRDGYVPTRVDIAIDLINSGGRPAEIYRAWSKKKLATSARKMTMFQAQGMGAKVGGETVYIGSRSSTKLLRAYDKAAERGQEGDWIRIELELKDGHAVAATKAALSAGIKRTALSYLRSIIKSSGVPMVETLFRDEYEEIEVTKLGRKKTEFEKWYWKMVFPAVEKALRLGLPGAKQALEQALAHHEVTEHGP